MNTTKLVEKKLDYELIDKYITLMGRNLDTKIYETNLKLLIEMFFILPEDENEMPMIEHYMMIINILDMLLRVSEEEENYERCMKIVIIAKQEHKLNLEWINDNDIPKQEQQDYYDELETVNNELKHLKLSKPNRKKKNG